MGAEDRVGLKLAGVEFLPHEPFLDNPDFIRSLLEAMVSGQFDPAQLPFPKLPIRQVFADPQGDHYLVVPTEGDSPVALPYITGSELGNLADVGHGGYMPVEGLAQVASPPPSANAFPDPAALMGQMTTGLVSSLANGGSITGAALDQFQSQLTSLALKQVPEEFRGIAGRFMNMGLGSAQNMIGNLFGGDSAKPGAVPGMNLSGEAPPSLEGDILGNVAGGLVDMGFDALTNGWTVDDSSSTSEQVAHKYGMQAIGEIKGYISKQVQDFVQKAVDGSLGKATDSLSDGFGKDLESLGKKIDEFINGVSSGAVLPAAHKGSKDDKVDVVDKGFERVLVEGNPVSRISDPLMPSNKIILEGAATVLAGGQSVGRVTSITAIPSVISKGAMTVLIGGPSVKIAPPIVPPSPPKIPLGDAAKVAGGGVGSGGNSGNKDKPNKDDKKLLSDEKKEPDKKTSYDCKKLEGNQEKEVTKKIPPFLECAKLSSRKYGIAGDEKKGILPVEEKDMPPIPGWTEKNDYFKDKLNTPLKEEGFGKGFDASIYEADDGRVALVFEGTDFNDLRGDWPNNFSQGVGGVPRQYQQAVSLAKELKKMYGDKLVITGHSLGGGLANFAGLYTSSPTYAFNAAGLGSISQFSLWANGKLSEENIKLINHFNYEGEILSAVGNRVLPSINQIGNIYRVNNPNYEQNLLSLGGKSDDHGINVMIKAIESGEIPTFQYTSTHLHGQGTEDINAAWNASWDLLFDKAIRSANIAAKITNIAAKIKGADLMKLFITYKYRN